MLLARYHLYDDAIQHFQAALQGESRFGRSQISILRMLTSGSVFIPRRSMLPGRFQKKAAKTMPISLCSEISTRI